MSERVCNSNGVGREPSARVWNSSRHGVRDVPVPTQEAYDRYETILQVNRTVEFMKGVADTNEQGRVEVGKWINTWTMLIDTMIPDHIRQKVEEIRESRQPHARFGSEHISVPLNPAPRFGAEHIKASGTVEVDEIEQFAQLMRDVVMAGEEGHDFVRGQIPHMFQVMETNLSTNLSDEVKQRVQEAKESKERDKKRDEGVIRR